MAPTLAATPLFVSSGSNTNTAITTSSFTPSNGEILVVKLATADTGTPLGAPTGGGQTYTSRVSVAPGGFAGFCAIYTAVVSGSPGSMTISSTPTGVVRHSMVVERWTSAQLAATPVTGSANNFTGSAQASLTTSAANSVVSFVISDVQSVNPSTRAYLNSATEDGLDDAHVSADGVAYYAWQSNASAGSTTFGLSAPTGQQYVIAGIEILDASGGPAFIASPPLVVGQAVNRSNTY
ncbi:MAG TPA: hypothetical protein VHK64_08605 [Nocardioidaceae bacterium]|nr:hypothetical protein [Nocardioidaceae bacterium]